MRPVAHPQPDPIMPKHPLPLFLTAADAARILEVTTATIRNLADQGRLEVVATTGSGMRLFRRRSVERLRKERGPRPQLVARSRAPGAQG